VPVIVIHSERFVEHQTPPGHPERPERAEVFDVVAERGLVLTELHPGVTVDEVRAKTAVDFKVALH